VSEKGKTGRHVCTMVNDCHSGTIDPNWPKAEPVSKSPHPKSNAESVFMV
jgi:hypothetical protein